MRSRGCTRYGGALTPALPSRRHRTVQPRECGAQVGIRLSEEGPDGLALLLVRAGGPRLVA